MVKDAADEESTPKVLTVEVSHEVTEDQAPVIDSVSITSNGNTIEPVDDILSGIHGEDELVFTITAHDPEDAGDLAYSLEVKEGEYLGRRDPARGEIASSAHHPALAQWSDCPGCDKCRDNGGYVLRKGSWRPTRAHEYVFQFVKHVILSFG